jgi:hypothetical protein
MVEMVQTVEAEMIQRLVQLEAVAFGPWRPE